MTHLRVLLLIIAGFHPQSFANQPLEETQVATNLDDPDYLEGLKHYFGQGVKIDQKKSYSLFQTAAERNHVIAMAVLGTQYFHGRGTTENKERGAEWYQKARSNLLKLAESGNAEGQYWYGQMWDDGISVETDDKVAMQWYLKAAEQDYAPAQYNLGVLYYNGQGVDQDYTKAAIWFQKAADQGIARAQDYLGAMYFRGQGVDKDSTIALKWYLKAAEQGYIESQFSLGWRYYIGWQVEEDYSEASKWFHKAANRGHALAQFHLGVMYSKGQGVERDLTQGQRAL